MFTEKNFDNLQFNPLCKEDIFKEYPVLLEIIRDELKPTNDIEKILRYVIMLSEPKSIVVISERDLNYRKTVVADLVGLNTDISYRECIFDYSNPVVLEITMRYLMRFCKSKEFAAIAAMENTYWESIKLLLRPIDETAKDKEMLDAVQKKSAIKNEIDADLKRLDTYYSAFFGDDKDLLSKKERIRPESIRNRIKNV